MGVRSRFFFKLLKKTYLIEIVDSIFDQLLTLQAVDSKLIKAQDLLKQIPLNIKKSYDLLEEETKKFESKQKTLQDLEIQRASLDTDLKATENQIQKYKIQQLEVKKNDEYQALTHQIEDGLKKAASIEEEELNLLLQIDEVKESLEKEKVIFKDAADKVHKEIAHLKDQLKEAEASIGDLEEEAQVASEKIPEKVRTQYNFTKGKLKRPPFVVALQESRCQGCYMKVSNETVTMAKGSDGTVKCENCGRIVYLSR